LRSDRKGGNNTHFVNATQGWQISGGAVENCSVLNMSAKVVYRLAVRYLLYVVAVPAALASVSSFNPTLGSPGDSVTIFGSGFYPGTLVVKFNGKVDPTAEATAADGTVIQAHVPAGATTGPINVTVNGTDEGSSLQDFTVIGFGPYITGFSPAVGGPSQTVFVDGVHFLNATNGYFNGRAGANFFVQSDIRIMMDVPAGASTGPISVRAPSGTSTSTTNFFVPPAITGFTPGSGRTGTNVMITGTNFLGALAVRFGGVYASNIIVLSNGAVSVSVSTNAISGPIRLDAPAGSATTSSNFAVLPTIYGFSPIAGPIGTSVVITGANLNEGLSSIKFSNAPAVFAPPAFGQVTSTVPALAVTGPISLTTSNGTITTGTNLFYLPAKITSFTPTNGAGGTIVTLTGQNFLGATNVAFNGQLASFSTPTNNTTLIATAPNGVTTGPISVTTPAGTTNSSQLFYVAPSITSFSPTNGLPGTNVVITGSNFLGTTSVKFNGTNASFVTPTNNTTLVATVPANAVTGPITVTTPGGTATSTNSFVLNYTSELTVSLTDSPDPVFVGSNLVYSIHVVNNGPFLAPNVVVSNTLPPMVTLVSANISQGALDTNNNPVLGNLGSLGIGSSANMNLTVAPQSAGIITNQVTVGSANIDPVVTNNIATVTTTVLPLPLLSIRASQADRIRVSWPATLSNYTLQSKLTLYPSNLWSNVATVPIVTSNENVVTETNNVPTRFYRLIK
jgi:hypothetical protein